MTTPASSLPAPPAISTESFGGYIVPPDVQGRVLLMLVDAAPFANSLTRITTSSSTVVFPTASPSGQAWVGELDLIPLMSLGDEADVVAVAKLAGILDISNETVADRSQNITAQLRTLLADSLSPDLDRGLLDGSGPPEPAGVAAVAPEAAGATLLAATAAAKGSIADAGGMADTLAMGGAEMAAADFATDSEGSMLFPGGFGAAVGLNPVTVPSLATPLVYDSRRLFCIVNGALSQVDVSTDFRFQYDATSFRVKARIAVGCPVPGKAIRKLVVGGTQSAQSAAAKTGSAKTGGRAA